MIRGARLFEVGDIVKVHPKVAEINFTNMNGEMREKAGVEAIIEQVSDDRATYRLNIDENKWVWEDHMFEYSEDDVFRAYARKKINQRQYDEYMLMLKDVEQRKGY